MTNDRSMMQTGRKCIGIEIEERYCEIAAKRVEKALLVGPDVLPGIAEPELFKNG